jgi:protein-S-isoprenylcysteine O-methyltransferase Ste14
VGQAATPKERRGTAIPTQTDVRRQLEFLNRNFFQPWRWRSELSLRLRVILRFFFALPVAAAILFIPAGAWRFGQAWVLLGVAFTYAAFAFLYLYKHDPELIERRLRSKEKISEQKRLVRWLKAVFFVVCLLPGFDYRLGWSRSLLGEVPVWLSLVCDSLVLSGLITVFWVLKVNSYASRTIEVEAGQKVISDGPYALVRHPMYSASLVAFLPMPMALGSYAALPAFALLIPFYVYRLLNEEKFLRQQLPGYSEYCLRTRFRLIPHVW